MKYIAWEPVKNKFLKRERGITFEDVMDAIIGEGLLDIINHPNAQKFAYQQIFIVEIHDYVFLIPYVEDEEKIFLKTIFPSRKYTRYYIEKGDL